MQKGFLYMDGIGDVITIRSKLNPTAKLSRKMGPTHYKKDVFKKAVFLPNMLNFMLTLPAQSEFAWF